MYKRQENNPFSRKNKAPSGAGGGAAPPLSAWREPYLAVSFYAGQRPACFQKAVKMCIRDRYWGVFARLVQPRLLYFMAERIFLARQMRKDVYKRQGPLAPN